jgi:hypothetical protein
MLVTGIMFLAFLCLRRTQKRQYAPRTYLATLRPEYVPSTAAPLRSLH